RKVELADRHRVADQQDPAGGDRGGDVAGDAQPCRRLLRIEHVVQRAARGGVGPYPRVRPSASWRGGCPRVRLVREEDGGRNTDPLRVGTFGGGVELVGAHDDDVPARADEPVRRAGYGGAAQNDDEL